MIEPILAVIVREVGVDPKQVASSSQVDVVINNKHYNKYEIKVMVDALIFCELSAYLGWQLNV